jgi:hypothetical protein
LGGGACSDLYAFQSEEKFPLRAELQGWPLYRIDKEFERQQLSSDRWRITDYNRSYNLPHFPSSFIVPASLSDGTLDLGAVLLLLTTRMISAIELRR